MYLIKSHPKAQTMKEVIDTLDFINIKTVRPKTQSQEWEAKPQTRIFAKEVSDKRAVIQNNSTSGYIFWKKWKD